MEEPNGGASRGKRVRRNDESEMSLSEEEQKKRQKNRDAARKCRQNKLQEVEALKKNNASLEEDNAELVKKKSALEMKVRELVKFIEDHMSRGCQLPDTEAAWWKQNVASILQMINPNQAELSDGLYLHPHPTSSPSPNISSGRSAEPMQVGTSSSSPPISSTLDSPMTLFSGKPLSAEQLQLRQRSPISKKSPPPAQSPNFTLSFSPSQQTIGQSPSIVSDGLIHSDNTVTPSLHTVTPMFSTQVFSYNQTSSQMPSQVATDSSSCIPSVVLEEEGIEDTVLEQKQTQQVSDILRQAREEPDMETGHSYQTYESTSFSTPVHASSTNLGSGGFAYRQDSYSDDLQTVATVSPVTINTCETINGNMKFPITKKKGVDSAQLNVTGPGLVAQALLGIQDAEMSSSLKQQIHSSLSSSTTCASGSSTQPTQNCEQNGLNQTDTLNINYSQPQPMYHHQHDNENPQQQVTYLPASYRDSSQAPVQVTVQVVNADGTSSSLTQFDTANLKYVQKRGHHFVLDKLPNGKHRVYEVRENVLVDTQYELQLKDSPVTPQTVTPQSASTSLSTSLQVVPQDKCASSINTGFDNSLDTAVLSQENVSDQNAAVPSCSGSSVSSLNLPSLSFSDLHRDDINVFAKKTRKKDTS